MKAITSKRHDKIPLVARLLHGLRLVMTAAVPVAGLLVTHAAAAAPVETPFAPGFVAPRAGQSGDPAMLRMGLTANTQLVYEPKPWQPPLQTPSELNNRPPQASLGLEFKAPPRDAQGPRSLFRVQLSGDSALNFRPRGGGMVVTYRSQF